MTSSRVSTSREGLPFLKILGILMVLTMLFLGVAGFFSWAQKRASLGDEKAIAIHVVEKTLQANRNVPAEIFLSWTKGRVIVNQSIPELKNGTITVTVSPGTVDTDDFKELIAVARWTNAAGQPQSIKIVTGVFHGAGE